VDRLNRAGWVAGGALAAFLACGATSANSQPSANGGVEVAVALPLSGDGVSFGQPAREGADLAIVEANATGIGPRINLTAYDDKATPDGAKAAATQAVASRAVVTLGPVFSTEMIAANPIYGAAGMVVLPSTATSDAITANPTTFRIDDRRRSLPPADRDLDPRQ
jgi:ABC-type branched-subunit amino acid transport system substrate-binding protein